MVDEAAAPAGTVKSFRFDGWVIAGNWRPCAVLGGAVEIKSRRERTTLTTGRVFMGRP
jgi:hypothetical protein